MTKIKSEQMATILAYTSPARSHLFPLMPVLDELARRGHRIVLRTLASQVQVGSERGFDAGPVSPAVEALEHTDWRARIALQSLRMNAEVFCARGAHDGPDLQRALDEVRPDAALVDYNCWGALMAAEAWGGPWATFCPYPLPLPSRDAPPYGPGLAPARGAPGRARDRFMRPLISVILERQIRPALNRLRRQVGLDRLDSAQEWFGQPPLMLYMSAEPFEYPRRDWPANVVMIGPCAWDPPAKAPDWLRRTTRPIVLVNTSTEFQDDGGLVRVALEALAEEPVCVVATQPTGELAGLPRMPANARVERFLPHAAVLERAVCAVTHGGMGSTQKALAYGVPVCAVPFGRDQFEVARRVEIACAGTRLPARRLRPDRLRYKVREAIDLAAGARRIAAAFAAAGGPRAGADAFEARLLHRGAIASERSAAAGGGDAAAIRA
ncbi:MAG TPA: glycosyltransferase [Solirubrobacteraceae bacterium]|nr:glycosyltransferase [Solirubrobacteraceae bacterium]